MSIYRMRTEFGHMAKWVLWPLVIVFVAGAFYQFGAPMMGGGGNKSGADKVIATVNGQDITQGEYDAVWGPQSSQAGNSGQATTLKLSNLRASIFQQLVQSRQMLSYAERSGIGISKSDVAAELDKRVVEALKANRRKVLGNISSEEDRLDPREDSKYRDALSQYSMTLAGVELDAKAANPESLIKTELAAQGIQKSIEAKVGKVSDKDIDNSYNQYKVAQIVLMPGKLPKDQMESKAKKLADEAKAPGADFAKLSKENSDIKAPAMAYSFDTQFFYPPEVGSVIEKMKPGEVSDAISTSQGTYIIKLEGVTPNLPAKLDKKARDERRQRILQMRQMVAVGEVRKAMTAKSQVQVMDHEMLGYWCLSEAQNAPNMAASRKQLSLAEAAFRYQITKVSKADVYSTVKLAQVLMLEGRYKDAAGYVRGLFEGSTASGTDLRVFYGDLLVKDNAKDEAIKQYQKASESAAAYSEKDIHVDLAKKFKDLGRADLAAIETAKVKDMDQKMAEFQARTGKSGAPLQPVPGAPKPAPTAPKPGG